MPRPMCVDCCRMWNAKTSNRSRIASAKIACPCNASLAGLRGMMAPLRQELTAPSRGAIGTSRWRVGVRSVAFPKSGPDSVGVARQWCGRLGKVDNCQVARLLGLRLGRRAIPWWTCGCTCPKRGRKTRRVWTRRACPKTAEDIGRDTSWRWTCWSKTARRCRTGGSRG